VSLKQYPSVQSCSSSGRGKRGGVIRRSRTQILESNRLFSCLLSSSPYAVRRQVHPPTRFPRRVRCRHRIAITSFKHGLTECPCFVCDLLDARDGDVRLLLASVSLLIAFQTKTFQY
jgi:hypothetical protein